MPTDAETAARHRILGGGVPWLAEHLDWFDPDQWAAHLPVRGFPPSALLELLIVCRRLPEPGALAERALDLAEDVTRRSSFDTGVYRADGAFAHYVWLLALLWEAGRPTEPWRPVVQRIIDAECAETARPGRAAAAKVEAGYIFDLAGVRHRRPPMRELAGRTVIGPDADPLHLTDPDAYVATHMVFYLTDFGGRPLARDGTERRRIGELLDLLLGRHLAAGDLDLSAELLAASVPAGGDRRLAAVGWSRLAEAQHADGAVPSPLYRSAAQNRLTGEKAAAYRFGTCYHTTLVAVMAAAIAERRGLR